MRLLLVLGAALTLGACGHDDLAPPPIQATVSGPQFAASDFDCGGRPLPPDPSTAGDKGGSVALRYENRLGTWGQTCQNRLKSVGSQLTAAGQVVH